MYPFETNVCLYASKKAQVHVGGQRVAGPLTPTEVVHHWVDHLPSKIAIVADSYFGGHGMAHQLALRDHPFLLLRKRDEEGVAEAGGSLKPGQVAAAVSRGRGYSLKVFKNPKVGSKPLRVVPFLTNCSYPSQFTKHKNGYDLPTVVAAYRVLANGLDSANQMALEHRETGRFKSPACSPRLYYKVLHREYFHNLSTKWCGPTEDIPWGFSVEPFSAPCARPL